MPLGEAYTALSQGIIDGVENPLAVIYGAKFQEEAKYLSMINYLTKHLRVHRRRSILLHS